MNVIDNITDLPIEMIYNIIKYVPQEDLKNVELSCLIFFKASRGVFPFKERMQQAMRKYDDNKKDPREKFLLVLRKCRGTKTLSLVRPSWPRNLALNSLILWCIAHYVCNIPLSNRNILNCIFCSLFDGSFSFENFKGVVDFFYHFNYYENKRLFHGSEVLTFICGTKQAYQCIEYMVEKFKFTIRDFKKDSSLIWPRHDSPYHFLDRMILCHKNFQLLKLLKEKVGLKAKHIQKSFILSHIFSPMRRDSLDEYIEILLFLIHEFGLLKEAFFDRIDGQLLRYFTHDHSLILLQKLHQEYDFKCEDIGLMIRPFDSPQTVKYIIENWPGEKEKFLSKICLYTVYYVGECPADFFCFMQRKANLLSRFKERKISVLYCLKLDTITPQFISFLLTVTPYMSPQDMLVMYNLIYRYGDQKMAKLCFPNRIGEFLFIRTGTTTKA